MDSPVPTTKRRVCGAVLKIEVCLDWVVWSAAKVPNSVAQPLESYSTVTETARKNVQQRLKGFPRSGAEQEAIT